MKKYISYILIALVFFMASLLFQINPETISGWGNFLVTTGQMILGVISLILIKTGWAFILIYYLILAYSYASKGFKDNFSLAAKDKSIRLLAFTYLLFFIFSFLLIPKEMQSLVFASI